MKIIETIKNNKDSKVISVLVFFILSLITIIVYWGVWKGFFQQDEWAGLGYFFSYSNLPFISQMQSLYGPMFSQGLGHFLLLTPFLNYIKYSLFGINYEFYAWFSLFLHAVMGWIIFKLSFRIFNNYLVAFVSAVIFIVSSVGSQAVIWVGTSLPTQMAAIFSIASLLYWFSWLKSKKKYQIILSIIFTILAVNSKETSLFLLIALPITGVIFDPKLKKIIFMIFVPFGLIYLLIRMYTLLGRGNPVSDMSNLFNYFYSSIILGILVIVRGIGQVILPQEFVLYAMDRFVRLFDLHGSLEIKTTAYDLYLQNNVIYWVLILMGLTLLTGYFIYVKNLKGEIRKTLLSLLIIFVCSYIPLIFIPTGELKNVFLSSRNLYLPMAIFAILVSSLLLNKRSIKLIFIIFLIVFVQIVQIFVLRLQIKYFQDDSKARKDILNNIQAKYPRLNDRIIFYTESDTSYYGLVQKMMPFQSGFGQTLLVWYYPHSNFSSDFYNSRFLWEIDSQGYKEYQGKGFGYFRDFELLKKTVEDYNIPLDSVIAFSWKGETNSLKDVSKEIREKLKDNKNEISY